MMEAWRDGTRGRETALEAAICGPGPQNQPGPQPTLRGAFPELFQVLGKKMRSEYAIARIKIC